MLPDGIAGAIWLASPGGFDTRYPDNFEGIWVSNRAAWSSTERPRTLPELPPRLQVSLDSLIDHDQDVVIATAQGG